MTSKMFCHSELFFLAVISTKADFPEFTFANSKFCQEDIISHQFFSNMKFYHL